MRRLLVLVMLTVFVGSGCGTTAAPGAGPPVVPGSAGTSGGGATGSGAVPDACTLITSARLAQILGSDPGPGQTGGADPRRSICIYQSGTITAVEVAANYPASRRIIEDMGRSTTDVPGVGTEAFYDEAGQLVARGRTVFVAVTAAGVSQDKLVEVCRAMLVAAGEA